MSLLKYLLFETIGEDVDCPKCNHKWTIAKGDNDPYFCHNCGWDQNINKYRSKDLEDWLTKHNEE